MRLHVKTPAREFDYTVRDGLSSMVVGNRKYDDLFIEGDETVSGPHVRIENFLGKWTFSDQFSNTGTVHNGAKKQSGDLAVGDTLQLGNTLLTVTAIDAATAASPFAAGKSFAISSPAKTPSDEIAPPSAMEADFKIEWPESLKISTEPPEMPAEAAVEPSQPLMEAPAHAPASPAPVVSGEPTVFEERITAYLVATFKGESGVDASANGAAMNRIRDAARKAVIELEAVKQTTVNLPYLMADSSGPRHLNVEVARKHLHQRVEDEHVPERMEKSPRNEAAISIGESSSPKAGAKGGVVVAAILIVSVAVGIFVFEDASTDSPDDPQQIHQELETRFERAREITAQVNALADARSELSPEDALAQLEEIRKGAEGAGMDPTINAAENTLKNLVRVNLQGRYNKVSMQVADDLSTDWLLSAAGRIEELAKHVEGNKHRKEQAQRLRIPEWETGQRAEIRRDNTVLINKKLKEADAALLLRQFSVAAKALADLADNAIVQDHQRTLLKAEAGLHEVAARLQDAGDTDPPLKFLPRPPKLPSMPANELLPLGGTTSARHLSGLRQRVIEKLRDGSLKDVAVSYAGRKATASGTKLNSLITVRVTRPFADVTADSSMQYETSAIFTSLPEQTQLDLLLAVPEPAVPDWLGILQFCFDQGFADKAGEVALKIRWAKPEQAVDLDQILSTKWGRPVPPGGFPERDGRIVPE